MYIVCKQFRTLALNRQTVTYVRPLADRQTLSGDLAAARFSTNQTRVNEGASATMQMLNYLHYSKK